jgi:nitrite reductase/ring-hydroxylating ferredoxin subunit
VSLLGRLVPGRASEPVELTGEQLPARGRVRGAGPWAVGTSKGQEFAVSRRCRHQFADLSKGGVDADGCLVCPWHQSRYDVRTGEMVDGPKGFLAYRGPTPGYSGLVRSYGRYWRLRVGTIVRRAGRVFVE